MTLKITLDAVSHFKSVKLLWTVLTAKFHICNICKSYDILCHPLICFKGGNPKFEKRGEPEKNSKRMRKIFRKKGGKKGPNFSC